MINLHLYSTSNCHLCELAEAQLQNLAPDYAFNWQTIEIADDDDLLTRYAVLIPVISDLNSANELTWPFKVEDIIENFNLKIR